MKERDMQSTSNEQVILDLFSAIEERDVERILRIYGEDAEFSWPACLPYGGTSRGLAEPGTPTWQESWLPRQPTSAERSMNARIVAVRADEVVVRYHQRGRDQHGNVIDDQVVGLYTVTGGRLRRAQMFHFNLDKVVSFLAAAQTPGEAR
jgi:ketosteroid isomerase-like protein